MSMSDSRARLVQATKKLKSDPLEREVSSTVVAMEHMAILLAQAQHECHGREDGTR